MIVTLPPFDYDSVIRWNHRQLLNARSELCNATTEARRDRMIERINRCKARHLYYLDLKAKAAAAAPAPLRLVDVA